MTIKDVIEQGKAAAADQRELETIGTGKVSKYNPTGFDLSKMPKNPNDPKYAPLARAIQISIPAGFTMPEHYLKPMTKEQINDWLILFALKQYLECRDKKQDFCQPKMIALTFIEMANLAYVNGYMGWDELQRIYKEAQGLLESVPELPSLKTQLKNAGKTLVGGVVGFLTAGPVGLFAGLATSTAKIVADERLKRATQGQTVIAQNIDKVAQTAQVREAIAQEEKKEAVQNTVLIYAGIAAAIGLIIFLND